jgi:integrase
MTKRRTKTIAPPKIDATMPLLAFAREQYLTTAHHNSGKLSTQAQAYKVSQLCGELAAALGRMAIVGDLTLDTFERLKRQIEPVYAAGTVSYTLGLFKALLRYAGEVGLVAVPDELLPNNILSQPYAQGVAGSLWDICEREYFPRSLRLNSDKTKKAYRIALGHFGRHLGREPMPADLDDDIVTIWLKQQIVVCKSIWTVRERLGRVLALWRWLACRRVVEKFPTVTRPEGTEVVPNALDQKQLKALFDAALEEPGKIDGIRAGFWWTAFLAFVWSTAERREAALSVRWEWIHFDRKFVVIPASVRKGKKKTATYPLWDELARLIQRIAEPKRELVFPWPYSDGKYYHNYGRILDRAGLPDDRKFKTHCLRCSHATWLEVLGGDASKSLRHSDRETTQKHYIDQRLLPQPERKLFVPWQPDLSGVEADIAATAFV